MSDKNVEWVEEVVIDSPVKVKMHYFGTEAEQAEEEDIDRTPVRHGFRLGKQGYLIKPDSYAELISRPAICAIPDTPPSFLGFINHRGETVPVFHLLRIDDETQPATGRWVLLLDQGSQCIGLLLTETPLRMREDVFKENDQHVPPAGLQPCLGETYRRGIEYWTEFDHQAFSQLVRQQFNRNQ